ncbi:MAG: hypothetical protein U9N44_00495 [Chloroflexota bacterium]|nr:hypothetical protein [Chloroflexota bacterium]
MSEDAGKLNFDVKEMPLLDKRGMCLYLKGVEVIGFAVRGLIDYFENGKLGGDPKHSAAANKKLSPQEIAALTKEMASYFCFEIVKQVWQDRVGELCEDDTDRVLNIVTNHVRFSYDLPDLTEKIDLYGDGSNQFDAAACNIQRIVRGDDAPADEAQELSLLVSGITIFMLHEGLKRMFELSEGEMEGVIEDFFVNYYPKFFKQ